MNKEERFQQFEVLFWQLSRQTEYLWRDIYAKTFPGSQSLMMHLLEQNGPMKMSEFANTLHITAGAVTTASTLLIESGYITRLRDNNDRRVVHLELTDRGRETLDELKREGRKMMRLVFENISDDELDTLCTIFKKASYNITTMEKGT